ncbi:DNA/RNA non-specific endonuclease [Ascidiimonas sp. W6]|uniref:DNA/RNA non-specific endonuclease n=1 Tax=Ascidiimonas meishanensis TaxID=3128903 RepID=UPI0030EE77EA
MKLKQQYIYPLLMGLVIVGFYLYEQKQSIIAKPDLEEKGNSAYNNFYLPSSTTNQIVHHEFYSLSYNELHEQAEWVAYELKKEHVSDADRKRPYFNEDPKVSTGSAGWRNYKNSGYDRGHLCPAGDRRFSLEAYNETFYTSNISPMEHTFNSGIWNRLEQQTRKWAKRYDGVFVVTGGILGDSQNAIGSEKVTVPTYFYKILLDNRLGSYKLIAFLVPHQQSNDDLKNFIVTVDQIELLTGIDFFPNLPDDQENIAEAKVYLRDWSL